MVSEQESETRRESAQKVVREWAEHDMNEHYGSDYLRDEFGSEHLEARIEAALNAQAERDARAICNLCRSQDYHPAEHDPEHNDWRHKRIGFEADWDEACKAAAIRNEGNK